MKDRWLSVDEISEYLGISKDTVYTWIATRNMPAHRVGRLWKFKRAEVDEWVLKGGAEMSCGSVQSDKSPKEDLRRGKEKFRVSKTYK